MRENTQSMIKIWIQDIDLNCIQEGTKPKKYWLSHPNYLQNLVELSIPYLTVLEWNSSNSKILLKD